MKVLAPRAPTPVPRTVGGPHTTTRLSDELISENTIAAGFSVPGDGLLDLSSFGRLVREGLLALSTLPATAEEGAGIAIAPGAYGPLCSKHETLRSDPDTFRVTIDAGGTLHRMFDVYQRWVDGGADTIVVSSAPGDTVCP